MEHLIEKTLIIQELPDKPINVELGFMLTEIIEKAKSKQNK